MSAVLNFDKLRGLIVSGYAEPAINWDKAAERQWNLAKDVVIAMAKVYVDNNVSVVLEAFATPHDFPQWKNLIGSMPCRAFALLPDLDAVLTRNSHRAGLAKLKQADVAQNHQWSAGWRDVPEVTVIDNSIKSINEVADEILRLSIT